MIPVHKEPASLQFPNTVFDGAVSRIRVRSEHCMGALKGRFQCLRGLRVNIKGPDTHKEACRWITVAIILHNLIIDVEGEKSVSYFSSIHTQGDEELDGVFAQPWQAGPSTNIGEAKRQQLTQELLVFKGLQ